MIEMKVQSNKENLDYLITGAGSISYPYKEKIRSFPTVCINKYQLKTSM